MLAGAQRRAFARAFRGGGSNAWLVAATAIWLLRTANRLRRPQPARVVYLDLAGGVPQQDLHASIMATVGLGPDTA